MSDDYPLQRYQSSQRDKRYRRSRDHCETAFYIVPHFFLSIVTHVSPLSCHCLSGLFSSPSLPMYPHFLATVSLVYFPLHRYPCIPTFLPLSLWSIFLSIVTHVFPLSCHCLSGLFSSPSLPMYPNFLATVSLVYFPLHRYPCIPTFLPLSLWSIFLSIVTHVSPLSCHCLSGLFSTSPTALELSGLNSLCCFSLF